MSDSISQADLDALFGEFSGTETAFEAGPAATLEEINVGAAWETSAPVSHGDNEILSQDDIDKMLAEFGAGT